MSYSNRDARNAFALMQHAYRTRVHTDTAPVPPAVRRSVSLSAGGAHLVSRAAGANLEPVSDDTP